MKKILIATDSWHPSINGVTRVVQHQVAFLEQEGFLVTVVHPGMFNPRPFFFYKDLLVPRAPAKKIAAIFKEFKPDYVWLATEGKMGRVARNYCVKNNLAFISSYQTNIPEYIAHFTGLESTLLKRIAYGYFRWFHKKSAAVVVATKTLEEELRRRGFKNLFYCPLGIDANLFKRNIAIPAGLDNFLHPVFVYAGRVSKEKNVDAFLSCNLPGTKLVIGAGPIKELLQKKYPKAVFTGWKQGQELVDLLSLADVFVFPSKTETFGLAALEALACGLPVAAYDVMGPRDIVSHGVDGFLGENLQASALRCLELSREACRAKALQFSHEEAARRFLSIINAHPAVF